MTINSQRLYEIQEKLESLLTQKKVLNSRVIADAYQNFRSTVVKVRNRQAADVRAAIRHLENSLKNEGAYKNVKAGFEAIKAEVTEVVDSSEYLTDKSPGGKGPPSKPSKSSQSSLHISGHHGQDSKQPVARATTVTLSQSHDRHKRQAMPLITRPIIKEEPPTNSPRPKKTLAIDAKSKDNKVLNQEDMIILNKAISKLFSHLEIEKTGNDPGTPRGLKVKGQTLSYGGATGGKQTKQLTKHEIEDAKELLLKLKKFEQELQKKRLQEQEDMQSLQAELQQMKSKLADQSRQLERMKGTHLIASKAKGKHVELLEERHLTEKKDIEEKLQALEKNIRKNIQETKQDKEDLSSEVRQGMTTLTVEILKLSRLADSKSAQYGTTQRALRSKVKDDESLADVNDLVKKIHNVGHEIETLRDSKLALQRSLKENSAWEISFKDVEHEIDILCDKVQPSQAMLDSESSRIKKDNSNPDSYATAVKVKLKKLNSSFVNNRRNLGDTERLISDLEEELEITTVRLAKMIDAIDKISKESNEQGLESVERENMRSLTMPSNEMATLSSEYERKAKSELTNQSSGIPQQSKRFEMSMAKVHEFSHRTKKYESLLQEREKALKELENDFMALQSTVHRLDARTDTSEDGDSSITRDPENKAVISDTCRGILKKIHRFEDDIKNENKRLKNELMELKRSDETFTEIQKEVRDMCKQSSVHINTETRDSGANLVHDIRACKAVLVKLLEESSSSKREFTEANAAVEKLCADIHKLLLFTDFMEVSSDSDEKKYAKNKSNSKRAKHASEELTAIHERFNRMRSLKTSLEMALEEKEKHTDSSVEEMSEQLTKLKLQLTVREQELMNQQTELARLREDANRRNTENTRLQLEVNDRFRSTLSIADEEKIYLKNKIDELQRKLDGAEKNLNEALKEKYSLLTTFSGIAGINLIDNNPSIADPSDPNRPTKLAEKFSELYDSEWSNAFSTLRSQFAVDEKEAIQKLLSVVTESFVFCQELAREQLTQMYKVLLMFYKSDVSDQNLEDGVDELSEEDKKQIRIIRKWCASSSAKPVFALFLKKKSTLSLSDEQLQACELYLRRCVELCWLMNAQCPPLHMSWHAKSGDSFDSNRYRQYRPGGSTVAFNVWPTLYLVKDGAVLCKGVVVTNPKVVNETSDMSS